MNGIKELAEGWVTACQYDDEATARYIEREILRRIELERKNS